MLQHVVPDFVQQHIETHEVTERRSRRLLVEEDLAGRAHPPVDSDAGLGLPQLDHPQPVPRPRAERLEHLPDVSWASGMDKPGPRLLYAYPQSIQRRGPPLRLPVSRLGPKASAHPCDGR